MDSHINGKETGVGAVNAVVLYNGILDAYEAVGVELIGANVLEEHVLPRTVYYLKEFLPEIFSKEVKSETQLVNELKSFMIEKRKKIEQADVIPFTKIFTMNEIWELRAVIFGYESVFIDILGVTAIKNYLFKRIADILAAYLPGAFLEERATLKEKLEAYTSYIQKKKFVGFADYKIMSENKIIITANRCAFSKIHDSDAYRSANTRFCPWGMIGASILTSSSGAQTSIDSCTFTTRGSISVISTIK